VSRSHPTLVVREARESDDDALAGFSCSTGPWFEDEVEHHIRVDALACALASDGPLSYRLLLFEEDGKLCAVGAHQPEFITLSTGTVLPATRLVVLGLSLDCQGRVTADGERYSDVALSGLMRDALMRNDSDVLTTLVALENARSQRLCRRVGLTSETLAGRLYVRMTGRFALSGGRVTSK
jgi:hypothetical protein